MGLPRVIQGGMGIGISNWRLAREVASYGQLGMVSGTAMDVILARRLQDGDPGGHMRRALARFPYPDIAQKILTTYFLPQGRPAGAAYRPTPLFSQKISQDLIELAVAANFVEVSLAKEGHNGLVGINFLEKIQLPHLVSLYGAMLADVDVVIMGAGIPRQIPAVLDSLSRHEPVSYRLYVENVNDGETFSTEFVPRDTFKPIGKTLKRPLFFPIISSATLAVSLARKASGRIDGFVVEGPLAGGHNAPPRDAKTRNVRGEPIYGDMDEVDFKRIRDLGLPFWIAGSWGSPEKLRDAVSIGAQGIQVGTAFAFCAESGLEDVIKQNVLRLVLENRVDVFTDPLASPSGFPFKVVQVPGSVSELERYEHRNRVCDIGLLRSFYRKEDGALGYRCPSEPENVFAAKGGKPGDCAGRVCICNGLLATTGLAQIRTDGYVEDPLITAGDDLRRLGRFLRDGHLSYGARDVLDYLLKDESCFQV